jgi:ADP-dependent NAD(P)H-hydrate dehydratase / NAD(P)H-hydrate epimerase
VRRTHGLLLALGIVVLGVIGIIAGILSYLPGYIEKRVVAEAKARGIALAPGEVAFGFGWVQLSGATAKLIGAPAFEAKIRLADISLQGFEPVQVQLSDVQVGVSGSLPRVLLELGEWTKNNPRAFAAPLLASRVSLRVAEEAAGPAWLTLSNGFLTRTVAGAAFSAQSCKLSGFEVGKVGAGFTTTGANVSIGFGDQSAQAAPLRLDASMDAKGAGQMSLVLTPTKLGLLGQGLGIPLPLPGVIVAGKAELAFPAGLEGKQATGPNSLPDFTAAELTGKLSVSLTGFVPPHPPELDGFVFGDVTTFDTDLHIDHTRALVTLKNSKVKAGKFELNGGGSVKREGVNASVDLDLKGALPCDALAGAAAESRLGKLLGRVSGKQGKRTALAIVRGDVSVEVGVKASTADLANAKLTQKIGVGCGLRPLSLAELLALTPNAKDLKAIGDEVGKKLDEIGKELGLPPLPSGLALPPLPPLPLAPPKAAPADKAPEKKLAAPAPSG